MTRKEKLYILIDEYKELFPGMERGIQQCSDEIEQLIDLLGGQSEFHSMAEIGCDDGGTLWLYPQLFGAPNCLVTIVDHTIKPVIHEIIAKLKNRTTSRFVVIQGYSQDVSLDDFDFLHIDGDHSYEAASSDFTRNWSHLKSGGVILIHDTLLWEGTIRLREEIEQSGFKNTTLKGYNLISGNFGKEGTNLSTGITAVFK